MKLLYILAFMIVSLTTSTHANDHVTCYNSESNRFYNLQMRLNLAIKLNTVRIDNTLIMMPRALLAHAHELLHINFKLIKATTPAEIHLIIEENQEIWQRILDHQKNMVNIESLEKIQKNIGISKEYLMNPGPAIIQKLVLNNCAYIHQVLDNAELHIKNLEDPYGES